MRLYILEIFVRYDENSMALPIFAMRDKDKAVRKFYTLLDKFSCKWKQYFEVHQSIELQFKCKNPPKLNADDITFTLFETEDEKEYQDMEKFQRVQEFLKA